MNKRSALFLLSLLAGGVGCSTQPKPVKPLVEQTKIVVPPPVVTKPTVLFTQNVREVTARLKIAPGRWKMILCHHSALTKGNAATYDKEHRKRGMENGLAYHFVIGNGIDSGDGEIEVGARWTKQLQGGHVRDEKINEVAIGICLVGNLQEKEPTANQVAALKELLTYLRNEVVGANVDFKVHCEADPNHTECPGKFFPTEAMRSIFVPPPTPLLQPTSSRPATAIPRRS
jgi:N-acetylmuramoyl-L-alanine amidase